MDIATVGMAEAKTNFSKLTASANKTGIPITVFKNNKPWVEILPLATEEAGAPLPKETREAMSQAEVLASDPGHTVYRTADSLFQSLGI